MTWNTYSQPSELITAVSWNCQNALQSIQIRKRAENMSSNHYLFLVAWFPLLLLLSLCNNPFFPSVILISPGFLLLQNIHQNRSRLHIHLNTCK